MKTIEYNNQKFKLGSVVMLKNETTKMGISKILSNIMVECLWMYEYKIKTENIPLSDLELIKF